MACCTKRSTTLGIPNHLFPPPGFLMATLSTAWTLYFPVNSDSLSASPFSFNYCLSSSTFIPSIPDLPPFLTTRLYAWFKLSLSHIFSINDCSSKGCTLLYANFIFDSSPITFADTPLLSLVWLWVIPLLSCLVNVF
jgi:hypothetical protein